jgi:small-conductance mechanosensitive channel
VNVPALVGLAVWLAIVLLGILAPERDPGVSSGSFWRGMALGALLMGVVPFAGYYALGRALASHRIALAVVWVVALVPFYYLMFVAFIVSVGPIGCPPDSYECPV